MEDAYNELYQQFLCLKSLCLRQAALLHELSIALQKQQGVTVPNGELSDMMSIPLQFTPEIPAYLQEKPQPQSATAHCRNGRLSRHMGTISDLLAQDMSQLSVDGPGQREENQEPAQNAAPLLSFESFKWQGSSSKVSKHLLHADPPSGDPRMQAAGMPVKGSTSAIGHFPSQSVGLLMSDVALQSHVCEFCQAVFPGDTTTGGEFLRHLCTHVT